MDDDLRNYKLQLQQVEAALTTDSDNNELLKLKADLEEVIELTQDLIKTQQQDDMVKFSEDSRGSGGVNEYDNDEDDVTASLLAAERGDGSQSYNSKKRKWKVGDKCLAKWDRDGEFYECSIEELGDNSAKVIFIEYNQREVCDLNDIRDIATGVKRSAEDSGDDSPNKQGKVHNREYLKKKKQKKQQRFKQIEEDRESEKNKWLSFNAKSVKKSGGKIKSIFASPDNANGRVGIGTCGISGKPMTGFAQGEKWKKGS